MQVYSPEAQKHPKWRDKRLANRTTLCFILMAKLQNSN